LHQMPPAVKDRPHRNVAISNDDQGIFFLRIRPRCNSGMKQLLSEISKRVDAHKDECVSFLQEMIRTSSPSGEETNVAELVAGKMRSVGFDAVKLDRLSDVMAAIKGVGGGRSLLLNGHLDHVPDGDMVDPHSAKIIDGSIFGVNGEVVYGRGASDMKGALAAMIMAGEVLRDIEVELRGDLKIAAVAQEEAGGAGTMATIQEGHLLGDLVIVGEATDMDVALGHRGSFGTSVVVRGVSCHASAPERGVNAIYGATDLIARIRSDLIPKLPDHATFGKTTLAVTKMQVRPNAGNVVPEECEFYIDCRNGPNFPPEALKGALDEIIASMKKDDPAFDALVVPTSLIRGLRGFTGFYTDPSAYPIVHDVRASLAEVLARDPRLTVWRFATDGRFYSYLGIPVLGFGPGEERFAHTQQDHVRVEDFIDSVKAYAWLACRICGVD